MPSGKSAKGLGLGSHAAKRRAKKADDHNHGLTKPAIRRLARRGEVKRISGLVYEETRNVLRNETRIQKAQCAEERDPQCDFCIIS